ncbi:MAG: hypothetical protein K2Z81_03055 [Cyanobacteria bacterium]|nr:hypothetical protein [Cyanobacteriota bacterium]
MSRERDKKAFQTEKRTSGSGRTEGKRPSRQQVRQTLSHLTAGEFDDLDLNDQEQRSRRTRRDDDEE